MKLSIELVFLFACALFVLHFIISGCGYTNVEGYRCGTCPISTAKCPNKCKTIINNDEWYCDGHTENCDKCGFEPGDSEVCLDTRSRNNLYIGNLGLEIKNNLKGIKYKYNDTEKKWYVYEAKRFVPYHYQFGDPVEVTDQDKLNTLNKLNSSPYHIHRILLTEINNDCEGDCLGVFVANNADAFFKYKIGVATNDGHAKHLFFSDSTKDIYCLGVPSLSVWDIKEFPHVVDYNSDKNKLQYIGYAPATEVGGEILTYC